MDEGEAAAVAGGVSSLSNRTEVLASVSSNRTEVRRKISHNGRLLDIQIGWKV